MGAASQVSSVAVVVVVIDRCFSPRCPLFLDLADRGGVVTPPADRVAGEREARKRLAQAPQRPRKRQNYGPFFVALALSSLTLFFPPSSTSSTKKKKTGLPSPRRRRRWALLHRLLDLPQLYDQPGRSLRRRIFFSPLSSFSLFQHSRLTLSPPQKKTENKNSFHLSVSKSRRMTDAAAEHKTMADEGKKYKKNLYRSIGSMGSP